MKHSIEGKHVLIAGGAKNLGGLMSRDLAARGAKAITVHYHSKGAKAEAEKTAAAVKELGADVLVVKGDLTQVAEVERLFKDATDKFGKVDIAVNTVGMVLKKPFAEISESEYDKMMDVNGKSAFFFIKEAANNMNDNGKICTIVTSLLAAFTGNYSIYAGAKATVEHFTRAAAKELGGRGISVTAVAPGPMDTPFFHAQETEATTAYHKSAAALGGLTQIEDIAPLVRFLVSEGWWITGQTIFANGGYTTR